MHRPLCGHHQLEDPAQRCRQAKVLWRGLEGLQGQTQPPKLTLLGNTASLHLVREGYR